MMRFSSYFALALVPLVSTLAFSQGYPPAEAVKRMQLPEGFTVRAVATEPMIRQPLSISFDERGRMWVLQYLQYPNPAGLKPVKQDQYLRTVWDRVPEPPPNGPKGVDKLTILSDPDENGVFTKSKDFVNDLNLMSGFCIGLGGVFIAQPPYLLFYADKNQDDIPDGDPEVLLSGFGMEDSHSFANSLQWGPDGWLYGAAGSTSTCKIRNPAGKSSDPPVEFQQGIWRYHPKTKQFELFSEGGGNTYGLDFDKHGQVIAGTNWGGFAMLHQMQGAYHVKGFSKHGPLHNPHTYGYFEHVPYTGFKGGHVTCGGVLYQADTFPKEFRDQYIAGNLLSNAVYWHKIEPDGSTFKARHGGDLLAANDSWCRPVDLIHGPDGSIYVADWYDRRAAHLDPVDNWDKTNGRIYKIEYKGTPKYPTFDLRKKTSAELVELLKHANVWWRREARRLLAERSDAVVYPVLKKLIETEKGQTALEAVWALYVSGGLTPEYAADRLAGHGNPHVRNWFVRLSMDQPDAVPSSAAVESLKLLAAADPNPVVCAQLACTAKRLPVPMAKELLSRLIVRKDLDADRYFPLLLWWAIESKIDAEPWEMQEVVTIEGSRAAVLAQVERFVRRSLTDGRMGSHEAFNYLLRLVFKKRTLEPLIPAILRGIEGAMDAGKDVLRPKEIELFAGHWNPKDSSNDALLRILARSNHALALYEAHRRIHDPAQIYTEAQRLKWVELAARWRNEVLTSTLPSLLAKAKTDAFRIGLLNAMEATAPDHTVSILLKEYGAQSPTVKRRAIGVLLSRPGWALELLQAADAGKFPKSDLTLDHARIAVGLGDPKVTALVEKHFGKVGAATAGEKQARIAYLNLTLNREGLGDFAKGKALYTKHCAACHVLFGEGKKVGPDLTTADRKNRTYLLTHIVDPSGYIRPEFISHKVDTVDGRALTGLVTESPAGLTLTSVVENQPHETKLTKADVDRITPLSVSIMPEKLLDQISNDEVRDLFAYLCADEPKAAQRPSAVQQLRVALISGSLEYKSDDTLPILQKYLETNYPVTCVRMFRKTDTDIPGLEQLENCDAAIFYTRRLKLEGDQLEKIKKYIASGKPVIGLRTASHGFQNWLEMDRLVFGGDYKGHFGGGPKCAVKLTAKNHPVLRKVKEFNSVGSLYKNPGLAKDVTVLLTGTIEGGSEPVAWVRERKLDGGNVQRVFYTSLGHPEDFQDPNFLRLVANGVLWSAKREVKK